MDKLDYTQKQKDEEEKYEAKCFRCGACCGVYDKDPCVNLIKTSDNKYRCKDYDNRIGQHMTASGKLFACIPIRVFLTFSPAYRNCAYSK